MQKQKSNLFFNGSYKLQLVLLNIFTICFIANGQGVNQDKKIDSLSILNYDILKNYIKNEDSLLSLLSLNAYLKKSKKHKDTANVVYAYQRFIYSKSKDNYNDSIISFLKTNNNKEFYKPLSIAFFRKGGYYYKKYQFNESLKNYLKADKLLPGSDIDFNIALIRNRIGEYNEALKSFQRIKKAKRKELSDSDWLWLLFALADTHRNLKNWDSTSSYINLAHKEVIRTKIIERKPYFTLMQGANYFGRKKYSQSIDSLISVSNKFIDNNDQANLMFNYYFTGISCYELGRKKNAISYFKKLDSLYLLTNHIEPEFRKAYEVIISESSKKNDLKTQLFYISRLLSIDSTLTKDYQFLAKNIHLKYDSPKLLAEKQKLIKQINSKNSKTSLWLKISFISIFILAIIIIFFIKQNSKNKEKFKHLLENIEKRKTEVQDKSIIKNKKININPEVVATILIKIEKFEDKKEFVKNNITLNNLAQDFGTNSKYLSQIIKHFKNKKFPDYINSLRIEYAILELKNNSEYNKFTLKAIAFEFGYNSTESFSSAFFKNTGLKPSYFLKELWERA